jgi:CubicO group peptidase (beta-lactamase class C family)
MIMPKKIVPWIMLLMLGLYTVTYPAQIKVDALKDETEVLAAFRHFLEELRQDLKIPGLSAAIVKDENVLWAEGFGYADMENQVKATPDTTYYLASLTKTFASTVILQLVEQGKLDLDTPVSTFGIRINSPGVITVRHLLSHTSEDFPGTVYRYNGDRYALLDRVIERASGKSFRVLLIENILKPLHLTGMAPYKTGNIADDSQFAQVYEKLTKPYGLDRDGRFVKGRYHDYFCCSAGIIASVLDMAKYDIAISQYKLLRPETQELAFTPFVSRAGKRFPYGLGWFTQEYHGVRLIWHFGYYPPSISTLILKVPDKRMTLIVFANTDALSRPFPFGDADVLTSPIAVAFFRMFIYPRKTGKDLAAIKWKSSPDTMSLRMLEQEDDYAIDLYKKELMAYWRVFNAMGQKVMSARLLKVYADSFSKRKSTGYQDLQLIAEINNVGDKEYRVVQFTLAENTPVRIYGIGEGNPQKMFDFGGIEDTHTGKLVWLMNFGETIYAGGSDGNRLVDKVISLPAGTYRLHYKTDESHSLAGWITFPPDHSFWGVSLYDERPVGSKIISSDKITPYQRLLDFTITGQQQEPMVDPVMKGIMIICAVIFFLAMILWPLGAVIRFFKNRKSMSTKIPVSMSKLSSVGTWIGWLNAVLGFLYVITVIVRGALEHLLAYGFYDTQLDVKWIFIYIPLTFAVVSIFLVAFTFLAWRNRTRSFVGRWFYTLFTVFSIVFVLVCYHYYLLLFR